MGVLLACAEDYDFVTNQMPHNTTAAYRRTAYARAALWNNLTADLVSVSKIFPGGAVTELWLSYQYYGFSARTGAHVGVGKSSTNTKGIFLGPSAGDVTKICLFKFDGATQTALATEAGATLPTGSIVKVDAYVTNFGNAVTGNVKVYTGGGVDPVIDYTGDLTQTSCTELDCVMIRHAGAGSNAASEIIVADEDTRTFSLLTMGPDAAGDVDNWTNDYTAIDETAVNDADTIYVDSGGQEFDCGLSDLPAGNFSVVGLVECVRACKTVDASISGLQIGVRTDGENSLGSTQTQTTAWDHLLRIMNVNPISLDKFTPAQLNALQMVFITQPVSSPSSSPSSSASAS